MIQARKYSQSWPHYTTDPNSIVGQCGRAFIIGPGWSTGGMTGIKGTTHGGGGGGGGGEGELQDSSDQSDGPVCGDRNTVKPLFLINCNRNS